MTNNIDESISFSLIIRKLETLAARAKTSNHTRDFQRLTLNHRILTELGRDILLHGVTDSKLLMMKRGGVFNTSSLQNSLDFFRWARNTTVQELADQTLLAAKDSSLLISVMALRSILEVSGNAMLLEKDLKHLADPKDEIPARMDWLTKFESLVDGRLAGVRTDYSVFTKNGLRASGKYLYKPGDFMADQTAKDLLKGVDVLDKRIKGARAAYDFFSEFSHPNLASVWIHYDRQELLLQVLDIHGYVVHHQQKKVGTNFIETFGPVLVEGIEIATECVDEMLRVDLFLKTKGEEVARYARKVIREIVKRDPAIFDSREICPCHSGKNIQQCCGKLIKKSKFGKYTLASRSICTDPYNEL